MSPGEVTTTDTNSLDNPEEFNERPSHVEEMKCQVPGTQKIFVKTYGCSHNVSDSEYMEGILSNYGFEITSDQVGPCDALMIALRIATI